jgi:hypothetical protein
MGALQTSGWALIVAGLAVSLYIAATGNWVRLPRPLGANRVPLTRAGRRISGLAGAFLFIAIAIEWSSIVNYVPRTIAPLIFLGVFALLALAIVLQIVARRVADRRATG